MECGDSSPPCRSPQSADKSAHSKPTRLLALDWLRGIAVLVMVECHVFNALLAPEYRNSAWFNFLNYLNGFVAPAFLLVAGGSGRQSSPRRLRGGKRCARQLPAWRSSSRRAS